LHRHIVQDEHLFQHVEAFVDLGDLLGFQGVEAALQLLHLPFCDPMHIKLSTSRKPLWHYRVATHTIMPASQELPYDDYTTGGPCHA
jgi:hypothetical protein